jgi:hypothetical protein
MICFSHSDDTRYQDEHLMAIMQFLARLRANGARILMPAYAIHSKKTYESYKQNYNLPLFFLFLKINTSGMGMEDWMHTNTGAHNYHTLGMGIIGEVQEKIRTIEDVYKISRINSMKAHLESHDLTWLFR